jgi:glycine/D-amino acid oxidase-like deaminating enzyme
MDLRSELPFWTLKNGLLDPFPRLEEDISCDLVIVGGGITGALLAYHLVEEGLDVVIIDKGEMGFGSTSASTGLLLYENDIDLRLMVDRVGEEVAVRSLQLCRDAIKKIDSISKKIGARHIFDRKESLYVASSKTHVSKLRQEHEIRRELRFQARLIESDQLQEMSVAAEAAIVSKGAGQIDPYQFCHQILSYCAKKGLRVYDRTSMLRYSSRARGVVVTTDSQHTITAKKLVLATGYEAQTKLKQKVVKLTSTYAFVSEPLEDGVGPLADHVFWETARPYLYARSTIERRIIVGGGDEEFTDPERRDALIETKTKFLVARMKRFFPDLKIEPAFSWAGTFGGTEDGLPYIGTTPEFPNAYLALGYGGNGMCFSVIAAEIIRDLYLRRKNPAAAYYRFDR